VCDDCAATNAADAKRQRQRTLGLFLVGVLLLFSAMLVLSVQVGSMTGGGFLTGLFLVFIIPGYIIWGPLVFLYGKLTRAF
jgi:uncharacterized membrane protein